MSKSDFLFLVTCFGLWFLCNGDPDLLDLLQAKAMAWAAAK